MAIKAFWTPQLEAKLHAWHQLQAITDKSKPAPCFTISREFGCQAYPLAEELARRLNARVAGEPWVIIGRQILDEVAHLSGYPVDQIEKSQDTPSSLKSIFSMFLDHKVAEETEVFTHMRTVIRGFAKRGNCILVGRGATCVTQDLPNCIHIRLVAPLGFRCQKIMKVHNICEAEAQNYIELHQQQRDDFVKRFACDDLDDARLYHLVFNNSRMSIENIAALADVYMMRYTS